MDTLRSTVHAAFTNAYILLDQLRVPTSHAAWMSQQKIVPNIACMQIRQGCIVTDHAVESTQLVGTVSCGVSSVGFYAGL